MQELHPTPHDHDLFDLSASAQAEVEASHVEVHLRVQSSSSVQSANASKAVAEIRELAKELQDLGIDDSCLEIESATAMEGKGIFNRGSSATFHVVARRVEPDKLVGVLQAATRLSHTEHERTVWKFDITDEIQDDLIRRAGERARRRAEVAAGSLGARLGAVHRLTVSTTSDNEGSYDMDMDPPGRSMMMKRSRSLSSVHSATGIELVKRIEISATASVTFHLASDD